MHASCLSCLLSAAPEARQACHLSHIGFTLSESNFKLFGVSVLRLQNVEKGGLVYSKYVLSYQNSRPFIIRV
jgi:hypothetical protein